MTENMKNLMEHLIADEAAANTVFGCESLESAFAAATVIADGYTFEEFKAAMKTLKKATQKAMEEELTDRELDGVVGGGTYNSINERLLVERYRSGREQGGQIKW